MNQNTNSVPYENTMKNENLPKPWTLLGCPGSLFKFFYKMLWNKLFGQLNIYAPNRDLYLRLKCKINESTTIFKYFNTDPAAIKGKTRKTSAKIKNS